MTRTHIVRVDTNHASHIWQVAYMVLAINRSSTVAQKLPYRRLGLHVAEELHTGVAEADAGHGLLHAQQQAKSKYRMSHV